GAALGIAPASAQQRPPAPAAPAASATPAAEPAPEPEAPDSPRASVREFLHLAREGRYEDAARYLEVPPRVNGAQLARRLRAVLDRHMWIEPNELSPLPLGDPRDGAGVEEIGLIPGSGQREPVRLVRRADAEGARWVFSRSTVERIDAWYSRLEDRWFRDLLPEALLRPGPRELLWWQWLALPVLAIIGWLLGQIASFFLRLALSRVVARTETRLDDELLERMHGPLTFAVALGVVSLAKPWLRLYEPAEVFLDRVLSAGFFVVIFWAALRVIDASADYLAQLGQARDNAAARSLAPLAGRIGKVVVLIMGIIAVLSELGYPVASLIAGLGIGGVALALAAQKTVENLFGSISIGLDRPFRVGDYVKIEDAVLGTVESIGMRSTRLRTLDRTVVTLPNGKLADMRVESYTARDRIRLHCILGVVYGTTSAQIRSILEGLERTLRAHPKIWSESVVVRFQAFGAYSLDIEVMAWFETTDWDEFRGIRQEVLLGFMEVVEGSGSSFAFPPQTLHLASEAPPESCPPPGVARPSKA
ncbi:MAG TPA: mechanosensitive ion channel family protein, partial [Candidatus Nanopelagicales bacterium]|nr:mechanosensitive ion channel family protein [Candidatus Nanopelagicales bacterium]